MIAVEGVSKVFNYGEADEMRALNGVSFRVIKGSMAVVKGPSGSGKTTVLGIIGCMTRPTSGKVLVKGKDVAKLPEHFLTGIRRSTFGFIFQHFNLLKGISVKENVMLPLYPTSVPIKEMRDRTGAILESLNMYNKRNYSVEKLSGGEKQRVSIARALVNDPEIILADEPTSHLDTKLSDDLMDILFKLNVEGKTIVIATHDPLVYDKPCIGQIIEMRDGKVITPSASSAPS
ncbi:MAG: ABC transporter ATP-binding protein [Nitrospirae bacterium]|nr:ABC transporter ATP-binding protein [Nitrospirota bacterium]